MLIPVSLAIAEILGVMLLGLLARRLDYIREQEVGRWSGLVVDFLFPALAFSSIVADLDTSRPSSLWILPAVGYGIFLAGFLAALPFMTMFRGRDAYLRGTFHHLCIINNSAYLPIIIIRNLWGPGLLPDLFLLNLGSSLAVWTIGVGVLGRGGRSDMLKNLLSPNIVAIALGALVATTGLRSSFPEIVTRILAFTGSAAVPCAILLTGAAIYGVPFLCNKRWVALTASLRLVVIPVMCLIVLKLMHLPESALRVSAIVALMPVAVASPVYVIRFGGNATFAAQALVVTTLLSMITVPLGLLIAF